MEQNKRLVLVEVRNRVAGRKRKTQRPRDGNAEVFDERKMTLNGVRLAVAGCGLAVKEAGSFARVAHSVEFSWATHSADQRAAQEPLEVERDVGLQNPRFPQPRQQMTRKAEAAEF